MYPPNFGLTDVQGCWDWNEFQVLREKLYPPKPGPFRPGLRHIPGFERKIATINQTAWKKCPQHGKESFFSPVTWTKSSKFSKCLDSGGSSIQNILVWEDTL